MKAFRVKYERTTKHKARQGKARHNENTTHSTRQRGAIEDEVNRELILDLERCGDAKNLGKKRSVVYEVREREREREREKIISRRKKKMKIRVMNIQSMRREARRVRTLR
jgi:hypothetical protein